MSNLGKKDRQIWYEFWAKRPPEKLSAQARIKFLFGDILELMLLFLAREAGHSVSNEQEEVDIDGVKGHLDATIDGVVVDAKSCSSYSFKKFETGALKNDDSFGYIPQLSGYSEAKGGMDGAFLAIDKTVGDVCLLPIGKEELSQYDAKSRIAHLKTIVSCETPPERCYTAKDFGASGNKTLAIGCSYCAFKRECWADSNGGNGLRVFLYSDGPKFFTEVKQEPRVQEVKGEA